jgi:hypothetical protein
VKTQAFVCAALLGLSCAGVKVASPQPQPSDSAPPTAMPPPGASPAPSASRVPRVEVELTVPAHGPVAVRLRVPKAYLPKLKTQVDLDFNRLSWAVQAKLVHGLPRSVQASSDADLVLDYTVDVGWLGQTPDVDRLAMAFDLPLGRNLPLWALVPVLRGEVRSTRLYPISVNVTSPLPLTSSLTGSGGRYLAALPDEVYSGLLLAGPVKTAQASEGLVLASFDFDEAALRRTAELERVASRRLEGLVGPRRPLALMALHHLPPNVPSTGVRGANAGLVAFVLAKSLDGDATSIDERNFLHELAHSSLPAGGEMPPWISEGLTEYFALQLALEIERWPEPTLRELLSAAWEDFAAQSPSRRAGESIYGNYSGGIVLAHCIEVRLRRDQTSLSTVLKKARERGHGTVTNDSYEQEIALASAPAGARIVSALRDPLDPVSECFAEEALVLRAPVAGVSEPWLRAVLGIAALDSSSSHTGVLVTGIDPTSLLRREDRIVTIDGTRVVGEDHLRELLAATLTGKVHLEVFRGGVRTGLDLQVQGGPWDLRRVDRAVWGPKVAR